VRAVAAIVVMVALSGCDQGAKTAAMPAVVQQMVAAEFPADGEIHEQSRRKIVVGPTTKFCTYVPGFGIDGLNQAFQKIGQSNYVNDTNRTNYTFGDRVSPECDGKFGSSDIIYIASHLSSRDDKSYRLILSIWQGGSAGAPTAVWVGGIERMDGGSLPDISNPYDRNPLPFKLEEDVRDLSRKFLNNVFGDK
jgi:hypothetical protein